MTASRELAALADELDAKLPVFHGRERDLIVRVVTALRLAATPARDVREALAREEKYLLEHFDADCGIMPSDVEGSLHRIRESLASAPEAGDPDMPDLRLCSFNYLADELRRRGATVTPAGHGGDFSNG